MWQHTRVILPASVIVLLLSLPCAVVQANNNVANNSAQTTAPVTDQNKPQKVTTTKAKVTTVRARDKSVLDAEVLDSPLAYFREAFTPDGEESDGSAAPAVVNTVKALVATLLSTVL